ncbi:hypothetical protein [Actinoallomurus iriomotensis]|uniref:Chitinase n=1 Tax=Actinoallomurus iriomotensis TaxID=478107 RepID=A0A9W6VRX2_9ACTN|nr:hypothetical protein [Actinoallomurus iriomotensis]GLY77439.1 hypothetical protein Airi01_057060 [Actinoallomurus iriomotensis]
MLDRSALYAMVFLLPAVACLTAAPESRASTRAGLAMYWGGGDQHNGNGSHNRVSAPFNSPNFIRGAQTIINANSGGATVTQTQLCKRRVRCRLSEKSHLVIR